MDLTRTPKMPQLGALLIELYDCCIPLPLNDLWFALKDPQLFFSIQFNSFHLVKSLTCQFQGLVTPSKVITGLKK